MLATPNTTPSRAQALKAISPPLLITAVGIGSIPMHAGVGLLVLSFGIVDCVGRYRDYRYLSRQAYLTSRLANFYGRSFCGRVMISSINDFWRTYYYHKGYRWWHILPDGFPGLLLKPSFWRTLVAGHRH